MLRYLFILTLGLLIVFISDPTLAKDKTPKHLNDLSCAVNEIAKFNGIKWKCSLDEDTGDTLGDLSCDPSQIAEYDGSQWFCTDKGDGTKVKRVEAAGYITAAGVKSDDVFGNIISVIMPEEGVFQLVLNFKSRCELVTATQQRSLGTLVVNTISDVLDVDDHFYAERLIKDVDTIDSGECNPTTVIALKTRDDFNGPLTDRDFNFYYVAVGLP